MQYKKRNAYKYVLSNLVFQTDWKLMPKTITCDFEVALLKAIQEEFSGDDVDIACCEFHWKQALAGNCFNSDYQQKMFLK
jgi:hypothetical protein